MPITTDIEKIRADFPILKTKVHGYPLVYFDNGATSQKPRSVIETLSHFYESENSNIHRGVHHLSQEATRRYENARKEVSQFLNAASDQEIIFTRGTTEAICLTAFGLGATYFNKGDEILISQMEHHSNILPWQRLAEEKGLKIIPIPLQPDGILVVEEAKKLITEKTKLLAFTHVSNTLGTINPARELITLARNYNIPVLLDGAQAVPHIRADVQELDCDFYVFSGHKIFAPTGIGVLYAKEKWLQKFPPYQAGGGTIRNVTFEKTEYADGPLRFEGGTPNIAGALGLAAALQYLTNLGWENLAQHEETLSRKLIQELSNIGEIVIYGEKNKPIPVVSFNVAKFHPFDVGTLLDQQGIAVRTGHHCTQPLMRFLNIPGTIRASLAFYNTEEEINRFIVSLKKSIRMLGS